MKIIVLAPSRVPLEAVAGRRIRVSAFYVRVGTRTVAGRAFHTVLLREVRDADTRALLADHLWFNRGNIWRKAALVPGDAVSFEARSIEYRTGYWGPDRLRRLDEPPRCDYRLTPPEGLRIVRRARSDRVEAA